MLKQLVNAGVTLGCDPELFFRDKQGNIVGSELVIPETGIDSAGLGGQWTTLGPAKVVRDGVQVELHPRPYVCRANFSDALKLAFLAIENHINKTRADVALDFSPVVTVSKEAFSRLSPASQILGCQPSFNLYGLAPIDVEGTVATRVAGGHFHIGTGLIDKTNSGNGYASHEEYVRLLDICVGIPSVLLAHGEAERERRKMYGRAGEYRLPSHGLEYRTLSNFWLRSYPVFSLITGLIHQTCSIVHTGSNYIQKQYFQGPSAYYPGNEDKWGVNLSKLLQELAPVNEVVDAIQGADKLAAAAIWAKIRPVFASLNWHQGIVAGTLQEFEYLVDKGLDHFWNPAKGWNIAQHWAHKPDGHGNGWEAFATSTLRPQILVDKSWVNPFGALPDTAFDVTPGMTPSISIPTVNDVRYQRRQDTALAQGAVS